MFSGTRVHYDESCLPDPLSPYGAAKAAAETGIRLLAPDAAIALTSLIIGGIQSEHVRLVHDLATGCRTGSLFTDDIRCPVHVGEGPPPCWSWPPLTRAASTTLQAPTP
ncbi:dTDP-4-dehydrorhamnose reductase [Streptomyces lividans 1326]|uniref:dTDP-4-dehydrorhamnose reductase n=1 Tax=Streptomyces lividans 1326 TaxID=1200984 RepID=A0A7U9DRD8_STRLI|nr:dTDP-4-dehydrorhamnose reductase [Streptomyces lividans 1326]